MVAGVATEKPGFPSLTLEEFIVLCHRVLLTWIKRYSRLFICSLRLDVDTEKSSSQMAALLRVGIWNSY